MTQPTLLYFGPDGSQDSAPGAPKVFLRTLLHSSSKRGNLVENMYVTLRRGESSQNFSVWVYRDHGVLSRGSGLYVGHEGVALDHHFLLPSDGTQYDFRAGQYTVDVYVKLARRPRASRLGSIRTELPEPIATSAASRGYGIFFDWGPDLGRYNAYTRPARGPSVDPLTPIPQVIADLMGALDPALTESPSERHGVTRGPARHASGQADALEVGGAGKGT